MNLTPELFRIASFCAFVLLSGCGDAGAGAGEGTESSPDASTAEVRGGDAAATAPSAGEPGAASGEAARGSDPSAAGQVPPGQEAPQPVDLTPLGHDEGDPQGSVVRVIEFSDFGCVYCAGFHLESYGPLHDEFIAEGDVIWKYIPVTIGGFPNGELAALAGECASEQDGFAAMRDRLFEVREAWMGSDDAAALFLREAGALGLEEDAFGDCLRDGEAARGRIAENNRVARQIGVRATPTFIVQGHPVEGAPPLDAFQQVLRQLVAEAREPTEGEPGGR